MLEIYTDVEKQLDTHKIMRLFSFIIGLTMKETLVYCLNKIRSAVKERERASLVKTKIF